ncbi:unnamed protein product, partial [Mesorhabditis spiculigera]
MQQRLPDRYIQNLSTTRYLEINGDQWVVARFSSANEETILLGGNAGKVAVFDAETKVLKRVFRGHNGVVNDVASRAKYQNQVISAAGDTTIRLWDFENTQEPIQQFLGHDKSLRCLSMNPVDPHMFLSCSRDDTIRRWDLRAGPAARATYEHPHISGITRTPSTPRSRAALSITCVQFVGEHQFVSGSEKAYTGVRLWDVRYMKAGRKGLTPIHVFGPSASDKGISSIAVDRFGSTLYVNLTDRYIHEYSLASQSLKPVRILDKHQVYNQFEVAQLACSPISDHLACGLKDGETAIWDFQDYHADAFDAPWESRWRPEEKPKAKWQLQGLGPDACLSVGWSRTGKYFFAMDEVAMRVWDGATPFVSRAVDDSEVPRVHRLRPLLRPDIQKRPPNRAPPERIPLQAMVISPSKDNIMLNALNGPTNQSPLKRTRLMGSPRTPVAKRSRFDQISPVLPPSSFSPAKSARSPRGVGLSTPLKTPNKTPIKRGQRRNAVYHAKYPTFKLPNLRYDQMRRKLLDREISRLEAEDGPSTSSPAVQSPNSMDDWLRRPARNGHPARLVKLNYPTAEEFGDSLCSQIMTEAERLEASSPQKKVIRTPNKATPVKSSAPSGSRRRLTFDSDDGQSPPMNRGARALALTQVRSTPKTPRSQKTPTRSSTVRNILDYFPKTPK